MSKLKVNIINNSLDGIPEINLRGDIGQYDAEYISRQIQNAYDYNGNSNRTLRLNINSFGGNVKDAYTIVAAMQKFMDAGGLIETVVEAVADSSAGWIAACGTRGKREIMQFGSMMTHEPFFSDGTKIDDLAKGSEERQILERTLDDLINIFVAATGQEYEVIRKLMKDGTDLTAQQAVEYGLMDRVLRINNIPNLKNELTREEIVNATNAMKFEVKQTLSGNNNKNNMKEIAKILNLTPEAAENVVKWEVEKIINKNAQLEQDLNAKSKELETVTAERDTLKNEIEQEKEKAIVNYVDELVKLDKTKEDKKASLLNMAKSDFEAFKTFMPLEKQDQRGAIIDSTIEEEGNRDEIELSEAKKFVAMSEEEKTKLKNSDYPKFKKLVNAYEKHATKII